MTGNVLIDLAISLAGVSFLVGVSYFLGAWKTIIIDIPSAEERLAFDEPDFMPVEWLLDKQGRAAAARNQSGETALVFRKGDQLASRRLNLEDLRIHVNGAVLTVKMRGDHTLPPVSIIADGDDLAVAWRDKLTP